MKKGRGTGEGRRRSEGVTMELSFSLKILYQLITFSIAWASFPSLIKQDSV